VPKFNIHKTFVLFWLVSLAFLSGCTAQKNAMFEEKARAIFQDENVQFSPDPSARFVLCYVEQKGTAQQPSNVIRWVIYDKKDAVFRPKDAIHTENGEVQWEEAGLLRVLSLPGMMRQGETPEDYVRIFDAAKGAFLVKEEDD